MDFVLKLLLDLCFQGGYNLSSVEESMCACTSSLLGDPCPRLDGPMTPCGR